MEKQNQEEFLAKVEKLRKEGGVDLSATEDLSIAVMNLVSLEEHFYFTAMKTGNGEYHDISKNIRSIRKEMLAKLMPEHEGETWCASKHLLATSMRLIETGNRYIAENKKEEASMMFNRAYELYSIFWSLKLKLTEVKKIDKEEDENKNKKWQLQDLVTKLADCCNEN